MQTIYLSKIAAQERAGNDTIFDVLQKLGIQPAATTVSGKRTFRMYDKALLDSKRVEFVKELNDVRTAGAALSKAALIAAPRPGRPKTVSLTPDLSEQNIVTLGEIQVMRKILNRWASRNNGV
jgi:hypothetical protein